MEACPVVLFAGRAVSLPTELRKIVFSWGALDDTAPGHCLALGHGSMYNHDNPANIRYGADLVTRSLRFVAIRDIAMGEELTINDNAEGGGHAGSDSWFTGQGIRPYRPD